MRQFVLAAIAALLLAGTAHAAAIGHGLRFTGAAQPSAAPAAGLPGTQVQASAEAGR